VRFEIGHIMFTEMVGYSALSQPERRLKLFEFFKLTD
jgi:hypothetical protein